jgi:hypothetical protein
MLKRITNKLRGIDSFYAGIDLGKIDLYQRYFQKILDSVDVANFTQWGARDSGYNKAQAQKDKATIEAILANQAAQEGLDPNYLKVMTYQYFFADGWRRAQDKDQWAKRVLHRQRADYFPNAAEVRRLLG